MNPESNVRGDFLKRLAFDVVTYFVWVVFIYQLTIGRLTFAEWVNAWHQWDAEWYFRIWRDGYGQDPTTLAFPPGFSWLIGYLSEFFHAPFDLVAMIFNLTAYFIAMVIASEFALHRWNSPHRPLWLLLLANPVGFYAFAPYSDCLFMMMFWWSLVLAVRPFRYLKRGEKIMSVTLIVLAPLVRLTGFTFAVWLFFGRWQALMVVFPLAFLLGVNWLATDNPFYFLSAQQRFIMPEGWFGSGLREHLGQFTQVPPAWDAEAVFFWLQATVLPLSSLGLILLAAIWLARRREWLCALTLIAIAVFSRNQAFWRSALRYDLPLLPVVFASCVSLLKPWTMARSVPERAVSIIASAMIFLLWCACLAVQAAMAIRMHAGAWTF